MEAEELFLKHVGAIDRIIGFVCRRNRVEASEQEEFASEVKLALIERNYEIIRKFEGRSSFSTYMTTVIQRLFYQYRVKLWGKWRPSAEARRMGDTAVVFEQLVTRDGYSVGEAIEKLTTGCVGCTRGELEAIYLRLPLRQARPVLVSHAVVPERESADPDADDRVARGERRTKARLASRVLDEAMQRLAAEDQVILRLRFWQAQRVPEIAATLHLEPKKTYKKIEKLLNRLRRELERGGVSGSDVEELLARGDQDICIGTNLQGGNPPGRPSHRRDGGIGSGTTSRL